MVHRTTARAAQLRNQQKSNTRAGTPSWHFFIQPAVGPSEIRSATAAPDAQNRRLGAGADKKLDSAGRGAVFIVGIPLASDHALVIAAIRETGLLVPTAGDHVLRLLAPLNANSADLAKSVEVIRGGLNTAA